LYQFDYIAVCNISWAVLLLGHSCDWFGSWRRMGAFESPAAFLAVAKKVNDLTKRHALLDYPRTCFVECGTLLGYRNPPFPGFDVVLETQELASGGDVHGLSRTALDADFVSTLPSLSFIPHTIPFISFHDYVVSGSWTTSGASSEGRVEWSLGSDSGHFKARKNLVPDSIDLEAFYQRIISQSKQVNKTIVKAELGKIRLAVSSDLATYLKMDWLTKYMTHSYKSWAGSTIEESITEQTSRQARMWQQCVQGMWCLPFDFAGFDHQPSTQELVAMFRAWGESTIPYVDLAGQSEFAVILEQVCGSMSNSVLIVTFEGVVRTFPVVGGLMSGLRWTSLAGNGWNTTMTNLVMRYCSIMLLPTSTYVSDLRGDDSALAFSSWASALVFRLGYTAVNAKGADGKFAIHHGATEFLRTWYDSSGLSGYAARTIPALVQRKPWSPAPWYEESVMEALFNVIRILRRRIPSPAVELAWSSIKLCWSRRKRVSQDWLQIPRPKGLGIEPWDGRVWAETNYGTRRSVSPTLSTNGFTQAQFAKSEFAARYPASQSTLAAVAQRALFSKASADDIPALNTLLRAGFTQTAGRTHRLPEVRLPTSFYAQLTGRSNELRGIEADASAHRHYSHLSGAWYGSYRRDHNEFEYASAIARETGASGLRLFEEYHPDFEVDRMNLEKRGLRRSQAVDWLFGTSAFGIASRVHPILSSVLTSATVQFLSTWLYSPTVAHHFQAVSSLVTTVLEASLFSSPLSLRLYKW
jgi:hypothetical protein